MKKFDVILIGAGAVGNAAAPRSPAAVSVYWYWKHRQILLRHIGRKHGVLHAGFNNIPAL